MKGSSMSKGNSFLMQKQWLLLQCSQLLCLSEHPSHLSRSCSLGAQWNQWNRIRKNQKIGRSFRSEMPYTTKEGKSRCIVVSVQKQFILYYYLLVIILFICSTMVIMVLFICIPIQNS